jgi:2-oxoglutarate ferredoxin oxidoreductase subunit delta
MARRGSVVIDRDLCKGCFLCIRACPLKILEEDTRPNSTGSYPSRVVHGEKCIACGNCFEVCPDVCIEIFELEAGETAAASVGGCA